MRGRGCSDQLSTNLKFFGLHVKHFTSPRKHYMSSKKRGGGSIRLGGCFSSVGSKKLLRFKEKIDGGKYRAVQEC